MTRPRILVARPSPGCEETVAVLERLGFAAQAAPVLELVPVAETPALRRRVQRLDEYDAVVFVSPGAVRHGMPWIERFWPQLPVRPRWFAVGGRTAALLAERDVRAEMPEADESAEGLLSTPAFREAAGEAVLVVRGRGGREVLARGLAAAGVRVEYLEVYARRSREVALPPPAEVDAVVASSGEVVEALLAAGGAALAERLLVVPSERVARIARGAGFRSVRVAAGAGPAAAARALADAGLAPRPTEVGQ